MGTFYTEIAPFYHDLFPVQRTFIDWSTRHLPPGASILDAGCGNGMTAGALREAGFDVMGVDTDAAMIDHGRQQWPSIPFKILDLRFLDRLSKTFHGICCLGNVISYLPDPDKGRFLRIASSLLKPNGLIVMQCVNWDALIRVARYAFPEKRLPKRQVLFQREYSLIRPDRVVFTVRVSIGDHVVEERDHLFPVLISAVESMAQTAGLIRVLHAADFSGKPYDPLAMTGNVFVFRKADKEL
ncbi:class I SAM-dependent methyltransferase [bacterium]|nr:class I SAM-dependent methyltransferase [candidate division CSSED10-310 bacterium]